MKSFIKKISVALLATIALTAAGLGVTAVYADDESDEITKAATSISISPVSDIVAIEADSVYTNSFKVTNSSDNDLNFEVYASPYAYSYSEEDSEYKLGFNKETTYNQIVRWTSFKNTEGKWVETAKFVAKPGETVEVEYRISTPSSVPSGGQYEVLFAHTLSGEATSTGIKVEASPGLVVYGRSTGETINKGEITDMKIRQTMEKDGEIKNIINGTAKFRNDGNVDFMAKGTLKVTGIFGRVYYETTTTQGRTSVIPESEIEIKDSWDDTPFFGLFNVEWTAEAPDINESRTITSTVLILPAIVIIIMLLLLTIIIVWIIIMIRKRAERRSRFTV